MATSLDILRPAPSSPALRSTSLTTTRDLEHCALKFAEIMTTKNFADPALTQLLFPDFQCQIELPQGRIGTIHGRDAFVNHYSKYRTTRLVDVSNVTTDLDEEAGTAKVMLLLRLKDSPKATPQEAVSVQWWKQDKGVWRCCQQTGMRGGLGNMV